MIDHILASFSVEFRSLSVLGLAVSGGICFVIGWLAGRCYWRRFLTVAAELDCENGKWFERIERRKEAMKKLAHPAPPRKSPAPSKNDSKGHSKLPKRARQGEANRSRTVLKA